VSGCTALGRRQTIPFVELSKALSEYCARRRSDFRRTFDHSLLEMERTRCPVEHSEERLFCVHRTRHGRIDLAVDDDNGTRNGTAIFAFRRQCETPCGISHVQHLQDLGQLQLDQLTIEIMICARPRLESLDSGLSVEQFFDRQLDFPDLGIAADARIPHGTELSNTACIPTDEEKTHSTRSRIRAQDLGQLVRIHERQVDLGHDDPGRLRQRDFEACRAVRCHQAGVAGDLQCVRDALASAGIAVCDEDHLGRHIVLVLAFISREGFRAHVEARRPGVRPGRDPQSGKSACCRRPRSRRRSSRKPDPPRSRRGRDDASRARIS